VHVQLIQYICIQFLATKCLINFNYIIYCKYGYTIIIGKLFYAQVFDGDSKQRLAHICGSAADNLLSNSSTVIIVFSTDSSIQKAGFTMHWRSK